MNNNCFYRMMTLLIAALALGGSCSFDYGNQENEESTLPDIVMEDLDYVRVRSGSPQARFTADRAERYDRKRTMELSGVQFEQYNLATGELDAKGMAGSAEIELANGNVTLQNGIDLSVESEEITLETEWLSWDDGKRELKGKEESEVVIKKSGGTDFRGIGLSADVRSRQWEFASGAEGAFEQDEDDGEDNEDAERAEGSENE
ncbi:MAG: LPS export ABC transporter periplasmic protein LptC [Spirochaetaceae bacterium]|jgi:LPS export ABC transporter protein LptC|nr:LPS export ABC transporter periplasmic protein LptC [Spirochaetaceae bacterium]